ncbi:MAG TPA: VWA domain-containing protein [Wenzhouxiangellaceae bacterium]|nr:VWA domain-containing protein [Wenzhouxiangellaceae bacterium]
MSSSVRAIVSLASLLLLEIATASPRAVFDREPNDSGDDSERFRGQAVLIGTLSGDDVDVYRWSVDDAESDRLWTLELTGETDSEVRAELVRPSETEAEPAAIQQFGAESSVEVAEDVVLFELGIASRRPSAESEPLIVPPGEHLVRITGGSGKGDYRLRFLESGPARIRGSVGPENAEPSELGVGRSTIRQINVAEHRFDLGVDDEDLLWRVQVFSELGRDLEVMLADAHGEAVGSPVRGSPIRHQWSGEAMGLGSSLRVRSLDDRAIGRIGVALVPDGTRSDDVAAGADEVVAGSEEQAIWLDIGEPVDLDLQSRQRVWLAFEVDPAQAGRALDVELTGADEPSVEVCLSGPGERADICRDGSARKMFYDMQLDPGRYSLSLQLGGRDETASISAAVRDSGSATAGRAVEPNDERAWAAPLRSEDPVEGRIKSRRAAWFDWHVAGEPQLWRIEAVGESIQRLGLYRDGERAARVEQRQTGRSEAGEALLLDGQWLLPGRYQVRIFGQDTDYRLSTAALGRPKPGFELEPNDDRDSAGPMSVGEPIRGTLHVPDDEDHFHLQSPGRNRLVFELVPPPDGQARLDVAWAGERVLLTPEIDQPARFTSILPSGDFQLKVTGSGARDAEYELTVGFASPWQIGDAYSFMPTPSLARDFPPDGRYHKQLGSLGSREEYLALPLTDQDREISIEASNSRFELVDSSGNSVERRETDTEDTWQVVIPGDTQVFLKLRAGASDQEFRLDDPALPEALPDGITSTLTLDAGEAIAAFSEYAQHVPARLVLTNGSDDAVALDLDARASHHGTQFEGLDASVELAAGQTRTMEFHVLAPPDLPDDTPFAVFVGGNGVNAGAALEIEYAIEPVGAESPQRGAERFHGLVDLAWSSLGGRFLDPESGEAVTEKYAGSTADLQYLNDGMAAGGSSMMWLGRLGEPLPPLELAGSGGELHAFMFNQRSKHSESQRWREVEIRWGDAPDALPNRMRVELSPGDGEQFFGLDTPVDARYVQILPLTAWGDFRQTGTGLFRALAKPAGALAAEKRNLLDSQLGGHWIYTRPDDATQVDFPWGRGRSSGNQRIRGREVDVAFGFLQHRVARLERLVWEEDPAHEGALVERVRVYTSTESPVGPWVDHGHWPLERNDDLQASFHFEGDPPRARYLRLVFAEPESDEHRYWRIPGDIRAIEADTLGSATSALAYWGMDDQHGPWEPDAVEPRPVDDRRSGPADPWVLDGPVLAELAEPGDVRSYRVELNDPDNTLQVVVNEGRSGRLRARLVDDANQDIELDLQSVDGERRARLVGLGPGTYRLDVEMPPRSIAFLWDGSGSVAAHQPAIFKALGRFADGLRPGKEVANVMPLDGPLLINDWAEYPSEITTTLGSFTGTPRSSNSEPALIAASRALARRDGEHVIFLITDAQLTNRELDVWKHLDQVRPRIFTLEISHGTEVGASENRWYQNLMKSWANVNNGRYRYTTDRTELIRGFEAGMREVRQPTRFELDVSTDYEEPPRPGTLRVVGEDGPVVGAGALHLIFDASGSMLRRMEGGRRIDVARETVLEILSEHIPPTVPIALRAYGHTEPHSCETELLVAPAEKSHGDVVRAVTNLSAINLARTPLAASLAAVLDDLADYEDRPRLVVMLTDGEETCDGDVAAAVESLVDKGIDIRLNIVGFQIEQDELHSDFEKLAALGGGEYFDSQDGSDLADDMTGALAAPFRVIDGLGDVVVRGRVGGDAVELPPGVYELVVETGQGDRRREVRIGPGASETVRLAPDDSNQ